MARTTYLSYPGFLIKSISEVFLDSSAVENFSIPLHCEEQITWKVQWKKNIFDD